MPILNIAVVLVCLFVIAFPAIHLIAKMVTGAILAIQAGRLLLFFRRVRRRAARR